ncbi:MAG: ARPP-1 family domain-containing protein [Thermoguttaceae bacterium]
MKSSDPNKRFGQDRSDGYLRPLMPWKTCLLIATAAPALAQRPSTARHVPELASYLDRVQIAEPVVFRHLAVYPVLLSGGPDLRGAWLTLDAAIARGVLVITEKGPEGSVPVVIAENRSQHEHVFLMSGEVVSGGKQTRTVREDLILAPGQRVELDVFCVEARRWHGEPYLAAAKLLVPQSLQQELRRGTTQDRVWAEVARSNEALKIKTPTGSLEHALTARPVQDRLAEVRGAIVPKIPDGTVGFIFVDRGRALGAELFGNEPMARALLPKLIDSYAVDCVLLAGGQPAEFKRPEHHVAIEFYEGVCRAGSHRAGTKGSGAGIRTRSEGLIGAGVSLGDTLVHFGVHSEVRIVPLPRSRPRPLIYPPETPGR